MALKAYRTEITWENLNNDFYKKFTKYLTERGLKVNTIGKQWKNINACIRQAELSLIVKVGVIPKFKVIQEKVDNIFLTEAELKQWEDLDLAHCKRLENVRDLFLVACFTGARYSDLHKYTPEAITTLQNGDVFHVKQQKTQQFVAVAVHPIVKEIHKKHGGLPKVLSDQKMNQYLKEIAYMIPSLRESFTKTCTQGGKNIVIEKPKYELVCTHTARRSFATNMLRRNIPVYLIKDATGHKTEADFWKYVKMENHDKGQQMLAYFEKIYG